MAEISIVKISALPVAEQIGDEDLLALAQDGATKALAYGTIKEDISEELAPDATLSEAGKAADAKAVADALDTKVNTNTYNAEVSRVNAALATKTDNVTYNAAITRIDETLATKADAVATMAALATKANANDVTEALALKADKTEVNAGLALKADKTELTAGLATKQDALTFDTTPTDGSTNPVTSGGVWADIDEIETALGATGPSSNLLNTNDFVEGYYSSGVWTESDTYLTSDYIDVAGASVIYVHFFNLNNGQPQDTLRTFNYLYWLDANQNFLSRTNFVSGTTEYAVPSGAVYVRAMDSKANIISRLSASKGYYIGVVDTSIWVAYDKGGIPDYKAAIDDLNAAIPRTSLTLTSGAYTIKTNHAQYVIQRVTNQNSNIDTLRLFQGDLVKDGASFNMWRNSDAEGAIHIVGETDYVSGYHGSEIMTGYRIFKDGEDITNATAYDSEAFNTLTFYVESDVYHCYQDAAVADQIAFKRCKVIEFAGDKVIVSNSYIAQGGFSVNSARTALFQCYKSDGDVPVFTDFSVNSDFKRYAVADVATVRPAASPEMTEALLQTTYGEIDFKSLLTSGQSYRGSIENFASQNRIKFYFDTIATEVNLANGDQINAQFEFTIR